MSIKIRFVAPLLGAAAAAAIATAPAAVAADTTPGCVNTGNATVCDNSQIDSSPAVGFGPQYPYAEGGFIDPAFGGHGFGGIGGHGGGHGR